MSEEIKTEKQKTGPEVAAQIGRITDKLMDRADKLDSSGGVVDDARLDVIDRDVYGSTGHGAKELRVREEQPRTSRGDDFHSAQYSVQKVKNSQTRRHEDGDINLSVIKGREDFRKGTSSITRDDMVYVDKQGIRGSRGASSGGAAAYGPNHNQDSNIHVAAEALSEMRGHLSEVSAQEDADKLESKAA
ncbi:MAG: hypothetical protein Q7R60_04265 [bacterium]|nr:hypothetical protein [bacterium]